MQQIDFWSANPCGAEGTFQDVYQHRYQVEPWLPADLHTLPLKEKNYLEVGCGQAVDAFYICSYLANPEKYVAIDYSEESINRAKSFTNDAQSIFDLKIIPTFCHGDALNLDYEDETFDVVYSNGVIHHTPDPQRGINEVYRVLRKDGCARIYLYRKPSLKVAIAKAFRAFQYGLDRITGQERCIYKWLQGKKSRVFGTMFLECFGVPWMAWYTKSELQHMFRQFSEVEITPCAYNITRRRKGDARGPTPLGYMFRIHARK